jgi:hypothetical protein
MIFILIAHIHMKAHTHTSDSCIQSLRVSNNFIVQILILYKNARKKKKDIKLKFYPSVFLF